MEIYKKIIEVKKMINCKKDPCVYECCCAVCDGQQSKGGQCVGCVIAEDLEYNKERIISECEYAEVI